MAQEGFSHCSDDRESGDSSLLQMAFISPGRSCVPREELPAVLYIEALGTPRHAERDGSDLAHAQQGAAERALQHLPEHLCLRVEHYT